MITDPAKYLQFLETSPAYLGWTRKIEQLKRREAQAIKQLEHNPSRINIERLKEIEDDLQLFESTINFFRDTYQAMSDLFAGFANQIKTVNRGADLLSYVENVKLLYELEQDENKQLHEIVSKLLADRDYDPTKLDRFLDGLREQSKKYKAHLNGQAKQLISGN